MSKDKPSIPKGTRDFGPAQMIRRNFIFDTVKTTFRKFGFMPLETPSMENLSVLTGKYGDEGDQLIFKILNNGLNDPKNIENAKAAFENVLQGKNDADLTERALRYDLTVPFARYVVMNRNEISFPFKRYQIQPVWRADRPQKGRYREFYQCDADVVGTDSLICEAEIVQMMTEVLAKLGITDYNIKINNRKVLAGLAELAGAVGKETDLCVAIDKLDKIGREKVNQELLERGFTEAAITKLDPVFELQGSFTEKIAQMKQMLASSEEGSRGLEELQEVWSYLEAFGADASHVDFDVTLARGLSYYTGAIFEVKVNNVSIGSISGGGRYDNLTGVFGLPGVSGVGFSFGVDRIYDVMDELNLFPESQQTTTKVMISNFDKESERYALGVLAKLRKAGIASEIYPDAAKLKKQLNYANVKAIPFVVMIGSEEIASGKLQLKDMNAGEQFNNLTVEEIVEKLA
jgi:histidyl-tRNA synthetase